MSEESKGFDPYAAVIADLKAKRDKIDDLIRTLESLGGVVPTGEISQPSLISAASVAYTAPGGPGAFLGMSIPEATKKLLGSRKQALGNAEIVAALKAGGMAMESRDPINTIGSILGRRFDQVGDIVRVSRGTWGLAEWYPGRSFKKKLRGLADSDDLAERMAAEAIERAGENN